MRRDAWLIVIACVATVACSNRMPTAPTSTAAPVALQSDPGSSGMEKTDISGTIVITRLDPAESRFVTPSGIVHMFNRPELASLAGDITGEVTFEANSTGVGPFNGPATGRVTFQGLTGDISGQWTTNCKWDDAIGSFACAGTLNFRGDGDLEGVQFHLIWGPGFWTFSYSGTAFKQR